MIKEIGDHGLPHFPGGKINIVLRPVNHGADFLHGNSLPFSKLQKRDQIMRNKKIQNAVQLIVVIDTCMNAVCKLQLSGKNVPQPHIPDPQPFLQNQSVLLNIHPGKIVDSSDI